MQTSWNLAQEIRRQRFCTRGPTGSWCRHHDRENLHKRSADRDLAQEVLQDPDADIMTERSWTRDPHTEILHKWSYWGNLDTETLHKRSSYRDLAREVLLRILMQTSWQRDLAEEILTHLAQVVLQDPAAYPEREIMRKRSADRDLAQVLLQDFAEEIYRDLAQVVILRRSSCRDIVQEVLQDPDADILTKRSCTRDTHAESCSSSLTEETLTQKPCTRDPHTESLRKRSCRILMQTSWQRAQGIRRQRSCTSGHTGSWCRHHDREILDKRSADRDLAQEVLQDPDADIMTERSWTRDPQTDLAQVLLQDSAQDILNTLRKRKRPSYSDLAQVVLEAADAEFLTKTSCRSSTTGFWCTDPDTDLASTISNKKTPQHCLGSLAGIIFQKTPRAAKGQVVGSEPASPVVGSLVSTATKLCSFHDHVIGSTDMTFAKTWLFNFSSFWFVFFFFPMVFQLMVFSNQQICRYLSRPYQPGQPDSRHSALSWGKTKSSALAPRSQAALRCSFSNLADPLHGVFWTYPFVLLWLVLFCFSMVFGCF